MYVHKGKGGPEISRPFEAKLHLRIGKLRGKENLRKEKETSYSPLQDSVRSTSKGSHKGRGQEWRQQGRQNWPTKR